MTLSTRFHGKVLLATGGGSGIAAATSRRFAAEGGRVAVLDLDGGRAEAVASELDGSVGIACDVADESSVQDAVQETDERLGRIDCVLNAAGIVQFMPIEELSLADWNRMLAVHLTGTFLVCRETLPHLRAAGGGSIVNLASTAALLARPHLAGVRGGEGRHHLVLPPARARGRRRQRARERDRTWKRAHTDDAAGLSRRARCRSRSRRALAEPEEIATAACFLFSDESSFFTAALLVADGGATAL